MHVLQSISRMGAEFAGSEKLGLAPKTSAEPLGFWMRVLQQVFYYANPSAEPSCRTLLQKPPRFRRSDHLLLFFLGGGERAECGFGEHGFKHQTLRVFVLPSPSSGERAQ